MARHPYTHEMYLRTKGPRKKATEKWLSNPENKEKYRTIQRDYYRQRYQNDPEYRAQHLVYQKHYRESFRIVPVRIPKSRGEQRMAKILYRDRRYLKSVDGDILKFSERVNKRESPQGQPKQPKTLNRAKASFRRILCNLKRKANMVASYGGRCAMCGEDNSGLLQLHHVNGDGGRERREQSPHHIISEAIAHPNWSKYQLLCWTCHQEAHRWFWFFDHRALTYWHSRMSIGL
jgi:hypothetical protein